MYLVVVEDWACHIEVEVDQVDDVVNQRPFVECVFAGGLSCGES